MNGHAKDGPPFLFAFLACSWVPHAACHYYLLETSSRFAVGSVEYAPIHSAFSLLLYGALAALNLVCVVYEKPRLAAVLLSAAGHSALGLLHAWRLTHFFRFEVFGYPWAWDSSLREAIMELSLGAFCFWLAWRLRAGRQPFIK
jgi:hypothetical protein